MEQENSSCCVSINGITENSTRKSMQSTPVLNTAAKMKAPWLRDLFQTECSPWELAKVSLAELIGTGILVLVGCTGCVGTLGSEPSTLQVSFVFGLAVMLVIQSIGHVSSAHINPAITVGSVVLGKTSLLTACVYLFSQCLGATLGFGLIKVVTPQFLLGKIRDDPQSSVSFCTTDLHPDISVIQGLLVEIVATGILMFMCCAVWDSRNEKNTDSTAIKFGLTVSVLCMAFGPYTGCSMNPARSIGPAIWNNYWSHHWIFWFGPIGGALLSSVLYRSIFSTDSSSDLHQITAHKNQEKTEI